jgi:L-ribulokinase
VAVGNVDAHVTLPAARSIEPGQMLMVMGTSTCHVMNGDTLAEVPGMCGVVRDGITPGLWGYEAGQSGVGDIFAWWVRTGVPPAYAERAAAEGLDLHDYLTSLAARQEVGEHGLVALDWHSGNRSVLVDHELSGLVVGLTLSTRPEDVYRALLEATAFGTRVIVDAFESAGVPVTRIVACGGLPERNRLLMQIYADVTGRELSVADSSQTPALGAAMTAAVAAGAAAGGYDSIVEAARPMAQLGPHTYEPVEAHHAVYSELYREYVRLHDLFGRDRDGVMKSLKRIRDRTGEEVRMT